MVQNCNGAMLQMVQKMQCCNGAMVHNTSRMVHNGAQQNTYGANGAIVRMVQDAMVQCRSYELQGSSNIK